MVEKKTDKKSLNIAIASAMFGFILLSPIAIICGHIALLKISKNEHFCTSINRRMAYGGLILGYSGMLAWLYIFLLIGAMIFEWDIKFLFPFSIPT